MWWIVFRNINFIEKVNFLAKTLEGLEDILIQELVDLGAKDLLKLKRAVLYSGDIEIMYRSNLQLRTAVRVLWVIKEFDIKNENDLYDEIKSYPWENYISTDDTLAVDSVVNSDKFRHANFISLKTKDAIVDRFREKTGERPSVDVKNPTLRINIHIRENTVTLSLDSSGYSLHMRGYRVAQTEAPLNEVLAAGMIALSGWDKKTTFIDPMCGSGTLLCEAALMALNRPPHKRDRSFGFKKWKNFDSKLWDKICDEAYSKETPIDNGKIKGFDISPRAVEISKSNIIQAGLDHIISIENEDFFFQENLSDVFIVTNPPYDERIKEDDVVAFYKNIGDKLKMSAAGSTAWILSGHLEAIKNLGLRPSRKIGLLNGTIPSIFHRFDMYSGSKKQKYNKQ